jgi:hypothetical protein
MSKPAGENHKVIGITHHLFRVQNFAKVFRGLRHFDWSRFRAECDSLRTKEREQGSPAQTFSINPPFPPDDHILMHLPVEAPSSIVGFSQVALAYREMNIKKGWNTSCCTEVAS